MIDIQHVTKKFNRIAAVQDITFQVPPCSICGLIGYNGAGKTTLLKTAAGIYKPEEGQVLIDGENVFDNEKVRTHFFYIPDDLFFPMNSNIKTMEHFYSGYYPGFDSSVFHKILALFRLDTKVRIRGFSKGMKRQLEIAVGLSTGAKYLLLDESFDGLDPEKRNITKKLLLEYMAERECSMLFSSHNLNETSDLCDQIVLLNNKGVQLNASTQELLSAYRKVQIVFADEIGRRFLEELGYRHVKAEHNIAVFETNIPSEKMVASIAKLHPIQSIQETPMTLEEIFLSELEEREYETASIFG